MKMTPVLPCSTSNVALIPGNFISGKNNYLTRCSFRGNSSKALYTHSFLLPLSITAGLFPKYLKWSSVQRRSKIHILAATETDLVVEEPGSAVAGENAEGSLEVPTSSVQTSEAPSSSADADVTPTPETKTPKTVGKSNAPRLKIEELVTGATFTGKVRSVQPFGAFVDFGAFTDGLVHISNLSDTFVKDIGSVVSVGQEVTVRILEVNPETKRIALTMRSESNQRGDPGYSDDNPRPSRRNSQNQNVGMKSSKFVTGQELSGTVKNIIRAGCFISLPEGEEGFLPLQEEGEGGFRDMMGSSALQVGQEVTVRVLNMNRGKLTLTTKKENAHLDDPKLMDGVVVHTATNPFLLAFRKNKDIATFLDAREDMQKVAESPNVPKVVEEIVEEIEGPNEVKSVVEEIEGPTEVKSEATEVLDQPTSTNTYQVGDLSVVQVLEDDIASEEVKKETEAVAKLDASVTEFVNDEENLLNAVASSPQIANATNESVQEKELSSKASSLDETVSSVNLGVTSSVKEDVNISAPDMGVGGDQISSSENVVSEKVVEIQSKSVLKDELQEPQNEVLSSIEKDEKVEDEKNGSILVSSADVPAPQEAAAQATSISAALVKQLREETGAGMMDCKKALAETGGDLLQAQEFLRKKGLASADKKASRVTAEGRIGSYIHDSRIGVLLEVNCETDFVSRGDIFKELVDDLAMQVAACPQVQYIVTDDVPVEMVNKERDIEMQKEDLLSKPEQIRSKIVEGRIRKRLEDLSLLEQPYIKNDKMVVKDWVKQTIATIGENIKVKRFVRFNLGEGLEKKSQDFAAEVAAQTAAKPSSAAPKTQAAAVEAVDTAEKPPTVTISAALVKQLREETGAGMMDCKKALKESDGSIEKAQEYLRKKGLSAADKKSSRIAAEGRVGCYIHDSRIGVLIEVNCETDFVGRSEKFKEMVDDLAMQVAACPQVQYVSVEDIPESFVSKEKELEMQREDLQSKPENIREKIVEGRIAKRLGELALLEQPFIKDDTVLVKDLVKQTVVALGENIKVRRFVRFTLGEAADSLKEASEA